MEFDYNSEEIELFDKIKQRVLNLLEIKFDKKLTLEIVKRFRKFNFSLKIMSNNFEKYLHLKSFVFEVKDGEVIKAKWLKNVIKKTKLIYHLIDKEDLTLPFPPLILIDDELELIITEMVSGIGLDEILLDNNAKLAENGLITMATSMGELHGKTHGLFTSYQELGREIGVDIQSPSWVRWSSNALNKLVEIITNFEGSKLSKVEVEDYIKNVIELESEICNSKYISLINSDLCPDNLIVLHSGNKIENMKMIDLDTFSFYSPFIDIYYLWVRASCWCVGKIPEGIINILEASYLREYRKYVEISDEEFYTNLIKSSLLWMTIDLRMMFNYWNDELSLYSKNPWGQATILERLFSRVQLIQEKFEKYKLFIAKNENQKISNIVNFIIKLKESFTKNIEPTYVETYPALT